MCVQWRHDLSDKQLTAVLTLLNGEFGDKIRAGKTLPKDIKVSDADMQEQVRE